ncbi:hypothetical protein [Moorena sp. SIO3A2]|uniref:hypothetical protein n=1 Tax=Moorena sp. SIO3A2 TaxID=2607841 RepID=UPI0013BE7E51|nr:hypothetical protein [Moorena sp. SIO3A2]NER90395.1 hypothetical protein [Moorena sp. SIO3A2]
MSTVSVQEAIEELATGNVSEAQARATVLSVCEQYGIDPVNGEIDPDLVFKADAGLTAVNDSAQKALESAKSTALTTGQPINPASVQQHAIELAQQSLTMSGIDMFPVPTMIELVKDEVGQMVDLANQMNQVRQEAFLTQDARNRAQFFQDLQSSLDDSREQLLQITSKPVISRMVQEYCRSAVEFDLEKVKAENAARLKAKKEARQKEIELREEIKEQRKAITKENVMAYLDELEAEANQ